jgi:TolA-binding protein
MLKMIQSDCFRVGKEPRPPIEFERGLNTVLGSTGGSNAIGKSTFLTVIDFAFGGDDYIKLSKDVFERVGHHAVRFSFEFGEKTYYFFRKTDAPQTITQCDSQWHAMQTHTVKEYRRWLFEHYGLTADAPEHDTSPRFLRAFRTIRSSVARPLYEYPNDKTETAVENLMRLFNSYAIMQKLKEAEDYYSLKLSGKRGGLKLGTDYEAAVRTLEAKINENKRKINSMEDRRNGLLQAAEEDSLIELGFDSATVHAVMELRKEVKSLERERDRKQMQLDIVQGNVSGKAMPTKQFDSLFRFFPQADRAALEDIERFHKKISVIVGKEIEEEISTLRPTIEYYSAEISALEIQITESGFAKSMTQGKITQLHKVMSEIESLEDENEKLKQQIILQQQLRDAESEIADLIVEQERKILEVQSQLNSEMKRINATVTAHEKKPPMLRINSQDKSFEFDTPDDTSEGTLFKGLVVYDLSLLALGKIPVLIHDSYICKSIANTHFERILIEYQKCSEGDDGTLQDKQVFIAFDRADSFTEGASKILHDTAVLQLSDGGNELYGFPWNTDKT